MKASIQEIFGQFTLEDVASVTSAQGVTRGRISNDFTLYPLSDLGEFLKTISGGELSDDDLLLEEMQTCQKKFRFLITTDFQFFCAKEGAPGKGVPAHFQMTQAEKMAGARCMAAGNMGVDDQEKICFISNKSGDFKPADYTFAWGIIALLQLPEEQLADSIRIEITNVDGINSYQLKKQALKNLIASDIYQYCMDKLAAGVIAAQRVTVCQGVFSGESANNNYLEGSVMRGQSAESGSIHNEVNRGNSALYVRKALFEDLNNRVLVGNSSVHVTDSFFKTLNNQVDEGQSLISIKDSELQKINNRVSDGDSDIRLDNSEIDCRRKRAGLRLFPTTTETTPSVPEERANPVVAADHLSPQVEGGNFSSAPNSPEVLSPLPLVGEASQQQGSKRSRTLFASSESDSQQSESKAQRTEPTSPGV